VSPPMRAMRVFVATALVFGSGCAKQDWIERTLVTVDVVGKVRLQPAWVSRSS